MKLLLTGGAGYIGSHTIIELLKENHEVVVMDNLINSNLVALERVATITGVEVPFYEIDLRDKAKMRELFESEKFDGVIHFAGLKAVGESVQKPLEYYDNNLLGTIHLLNVMREFDVKNIIFSSSATVYGSPQSVPIFEDFPLQVTNPYGRTKLMIEDIMRDVYFADKTWNIVLLRYFNPIGAHESGLIGEDPEGIPNNLIPYVSQVAVGKLASVSVFGGDYETKDGTGVRDYIHVVDLARGHVLALKQFKTGGLHTYNLGTGNGYSVLDIIQAFEKASGKEISYNIVERRPGDIASCYADPQKALSELGWKAEYDLDKMCTDSWRWQSTNPSGYVDKK